MVVQNGTSYIITLLQVNDSTPGAIYMSSDASGSDASSKQSRRFNPLVFRQPKHVEISLS